MRSESFLDPCGTGLSTTVFGDLSGQVGVASQTLFVAPRG
jgi:hypothetical protein